MCPFFFTTYIWCFLVKGQLRVYLHREIQFSLALYSKESTTKVLYHIYLPRKS